MAVVDLPGAFLHAENDNNIVMFMKGRLEESMVMVTTQTYRKFMTMEDGQKVFMRKIKRHFMAFGKELYFFYQKFHKDLENMGFEVNLYDPSVANKMVNGAQMIMTWHVHDLKISHINEEK